MTNKRAPTGADAFWLLGPAPDGTKPSSACYAAAERRYPQPASPPAGTAGRIWQHAVITQCDHAPISCREVPLHGEGPLEAARHAAGGQESDGRARPASRYPILGWLQRMIAQQNRKLRLDEFESGMEHAKHGLERSTEEARTCPMPRPSSALPKERR